MIRVASKNRALFVRGARGRNAGRLVFLPNPGIWADGTIVAPLTQANVDFLRRNFGPELVWENAVVIPKDLELVSFDPSRHPWATEPRHYQLEAIKRAAERPYFGFFLDPGTGKTKIVLDLIVHHFLHGKANRALIVAPNGVHRQWIVEQLIIHVREDIRNRISTVIHSSSKPADLSKMHGDWRILAMNVEALSHKSGFGIAESFLSSGESIFVLDESSKIKNPSAQRTKSALRLSFLASIRYILSGTPITKGLEDLFAQISFLSRSILPVSSHSAFLARYCVLRYLRAHAFGAYQVVGYRNVEEIVQLLSPHVAQARIDEIADELPEIIESVRLVELSAEARRVYDTLKSDFEASLTSGKIEIHNAVALLVRLQQITSGWIKVEDRYEEFPNGKIESLREILEESSDKRIVIWARFRKDIELICALANELNIPYVRVDGSVDAGSRQQAVQSFVSGDSRLFVANPAVAGIGLNLQVADLVIFYSNSFDAEVRWQAFARTKRLGMKKPVRYIDLLAAQSIDSHILRNLQRKEDIAESLVRDPLSWLQAEPDSAIINSRSLISRR